ncbi:MAG: hypothetical protein WCV82_02800 [Candidatus Paceibacterota bacterium]
MKATAIAILIAAVIIGSIIVLTGPRTGAEQISGANNVTIVDGKQIIEIGARGGYQPRKSVAQAGIPTILRFNTNGTFDCSSSVRIPSMNISRNLPSSGITDIDLGSQLATTLQGMCGMGMYRFEIEFRSRTGSGPVNITPNESAPVSATKTVVGVFTCLPHRDTSGPQTLECAFGLKADDGLFYALDWGDSATSAFDLPMDRKFSVTGLFVSLEALSTDQWQKYAVEGIIKVSSYEELKSDIPVAPINSKVTLELNKPVSIGGTTIKISAVTQDSRCPSDVTCIQAGKVTVVLDIVSPFGPSSMEIGLGQNVTTETLSFTLDSVTPYPISTRKTLDGEYRFMITAKSR